MAATRERILEAALREVATVGYGQTSMAAVAAAAGVSTGGVYRYFESKSQLFTEVFARASAREMQACRQAAAWPADGELDRLARVLATFARRALRGRRLAWALLAEPVDPGVEAARLRFRRDYRDLFLEILTRAEAAGEVEPDRPAAVVAAALVGAAAEALVGPLSTPDPGAEAPTDPDGLVAAIVAVCVSAARGTRLVETT